MIAEGKVVNLAYSLKNDAGEVLDQADLQDPFVYLHGGGQIVPGLETALEGTKKGDKKLVKVSPAEGYGEVNPELQLTVKRSQFPEGVEVEEGMEFEANGPGGQGVIFTVESFSADSVTINGNHPLAGMTLHFDVEVLDVRDATEEEKEHGHAHGPDGHSHDHDHDHEHGEHVHGEGCDH